MDMEDCFILDSNPFDSIDISKLSITIGDVDDDDLSLVAKKGQDVEISPFKASRVRFPLIKLLMRNTVTCVTVMFVIQWLHVRSAAHCDASEHVQH
ncbi:hypothetical protein F3Y22_tig00117040pilonHSYRG00067 [Hibiscus syriacus]|uniref:Uncharacterized protein n=1 Tax=Hibiscus syriacus TaxID=106335 RepID=A0A6A2X8W1_HIBSY|nr:hypothetical protein F3Y22_tig00117040pilonHSYRG00067 [Hibiscus syriacus]